MTLKYKVLSPDPDENPIVAALDKVLWQNYHGDGDFDDGDMFYLIWFLLAITLKTKTRMKKIIVNYHVVGGTNL